MSILEYYLQSKDTFRLLGSGAEGEARLINQKLVAKFYCRRDYRKSETILNRLLYTRKYVEEIMFKRFPSLTHFISMPELAGYVIEDEGLLIFTEYIKDDKHIDCLKCEYLLGLSDMLNKPKYGLCDTTYYIGNVKIKDHKLYLIDVHAETEYDII